MQANAPGELAVRMVGGLAATAVVAGLVFAVVHAGAGTVTVHGTVSVLLRSSACGIPASMQPVTKLSEATVTIEAAHGMAETTGLTALEVAPESRSRCSVVGRYSKQMPRADRYIVTARNRGSLLVSAGPAMPSSGSNTVRVDLGVGSVSDGPGHPVPVAPSDDPPPRVPRCQWNGPDSGLTLGPYGLCTFRHRTGQYATLSGEVVDETTNQPIPGARVVLYIENTRHPFVAIATRYGQFAFLDIPTSGKDLTCGWQEVTAPGYGRFLDVDSWISDSFAQSVQLSREPFREIDARGLRCRSWRPPPELRRAGG